jgi:hypothetical protein
MAWIALTVFAKRRVSSTHPQGRTTGRSADRAAYKFELVINLKTMLSGTIRG